MIDKTNTGPLAGLRIIEIEAIGPVPFCGMMLADLGADIIRIDRLSDSGLGVAFPPEFNTGGRGRQSIALDLKSKDGAAIVRQLTQNADVIMEGMRPGVMERLDLGPDQLCSDNPKLVYARMTGWGQEGSRALTAGHDINYISLNGTLSAFGPRNGPPTIPLNMMGDYGGGALFLVIGILSACFEAQASGKGQVVDAAMIDGSNYLMSVIQMLNTAGQWQDGKRGSNMLDGGVPFYSVYETKDGKHMAVGALEPKFYKALLEGLGLEGADLPGQYDPAGWEDLRALFTKTILQRSQADWTTVFDGTDACTTPVLTFAESMGDAENQDRELYGQSGDLPVPAPAPRFSRTPGKVAGDPVQPGSHTRDILTALGMNSADIDRLIESNVISEAK